MQDASIAKFASSIFSENLVKKNPLFSENMVKKIT